MASKRVFKLLGVAAALLVLLAASGCGVKGDPRPPEKPIIQGL